ncbi:cytochrome P450 [Dactylosporangium matsuzakiense]|uniref:Cytochrome P450 n=1 Tax=Dactylosporangium matsuzakiense TaxID=53360 RepID=A0A9W6KRG4_9ACTN|nr:cytochrome P450 [Dactylosporangium matsuzakiense]UWZ49181.1 cytochrome P450 [Dactylosporangium matsuzakiense]GLL06752.1 cytochrome P450 [Dactylosporangium matsuzakiense]
MPNRLGVLDTARCAAVVLAPLLAQGVIRRRNRVVRLAQRLDLDRRAAAVLRQLRTRHGDGPLRLAVPGRSIALVLSADGVERVLTGSPEPFALATTEKVAALRHFQPHGVLISGGRERDARRHYNERVLDTGAELHHHIAGAVAAVVRDEVSTVDGPVLDWPAFAAMFDRIARRVVLGAAARDDERLTAELNRLRNAANWAYLRPRPEHLRARFQRRVDAYVARAEPGSLAAAMAANPAAAGVDPAGQVPHWLFAFDAAGISAFRTLALLGSDPARQATAARDQGPVYPYIRACVQDTVRLWPTTLVVLRESTVDTQWPGGTLPAGTELILPSSYFHRDGEHADDFAPETWLHGEAMRSWSVFPFSAGPGVCPGRNVVLLTTSTLIAALLDRFGPLRTAAPLRSPLPRTLDYTGQRIGLPPVTGTIAPEM